MTRCIIKFKDGDHVNLQADCIDSRDGWIVAWRGNEMIALVDMNIVNIVYLSEKKE